MNISEEMNEWLKTGNRGVSSEAIFTKLTGLNISGDRWGFSNHPSDPSDFIRCEKLLIAVPEFRERLGSMSDVSLVWESLVENWSKIIEILESECEGIFEGKNKNSRASKTYEFMKSIGC